MRLYLKFGPRELDIPEAGNAKKMIYLDSLQQWSGSSLTAPATRNYTFEC